eukprot:5054382-Pleurochrysis_carterae.AAC.5
MALSHLCVTLRARHLLVAGQLAPGLRVDAERRRAALDRGSEREVAGKLLAGMRADRVCMVVLQGRSMLPRARAHQGPPGQWTRPTGCSYRTRCAAPLRGPGRPARLPSEPARASKQRGQRFNKTADEDRSKSRANSLVKKWWGLRCC